MMKGGGNILGTAMTIIGVATGNPVLANAGRVVMAVQAVQSGNPLAMAASAFSLSNWAPMGTEGFGTPMSGSVSDLAAYDDAVFGAGSGELTTGYLDSYNGIGADIPIQDPGAAGYLGESAFSTEVAPDIMSKGQYYDIDLGGQSTQDYFKGIGSQSEFDAAQPKLQNLGAEAARDAYWSGNDPYTAFNESMRTNWGYIPNTDATNLTSYIDNTWKNFADTQLPRLELGKETLGGAQEIANDMSIASRGYTDLTSGGGAPVTSTLGGDTTAALDPSQVSAFSSADAGQRSFINPDDYSAGVTTTPVTQNTPTTLQDITSRGVSVEPAPFTQDELSSLAADNSETGISYNLDTNGAGNLKYDRSFMPETDQTGLPDFQRSNYDFSKGYTGEESFNTGMQMPTGLGPTPNLGIAGTTYNQVTQGNQAMNLQDIFKMFKQKPMSPWEAGIRGLGALDAYSQNKKAMGMMQEMRDQAVNWRDPNRGRGDFANQEWQKTISDPMHGYDQFMQGAGRDFVNQARATAAKSGNRGGYLNSGRMNTDLASLWAKNQAQRAQTAAGGFVGGTNTAAQAAPYAMGLAQMQRNSNAPLFDVMGGIAQRGLKGIYDPETSSY